MCPNRVFGGGFLVFRQRVQNDQYPKKGAALPDFSGSQAVASAAVSGRKHAWENTVHKE